MTCRAAPFAPPADAAAALAEALAVTLHEPGGRERHRALLERAIELAARAGARETLLAAHVARARDARHGAGQLSLSAQRAPTAAACDDGWRRVEAIVAVAEASAAIAARLADELSTPAARAGAAAADAAARDARRIVDERNHAYTFHADPGFSFGEGWYVAAAALLAGVAIQLEPGKAQTAQAARFLDDAGLRDRLQPYRSRPRANKQLTELVARAFRADPVSAQRTLRAAFLGAEPIPRAIVDWADARVGGAPPEPKVLVWIRHGVHHANRNTTHPELVDLARRARDAGLVPVLVGDALRGAAPPGAVDLSLFWKERPFQGPDQRRAQLQLFEHLRRAHHVVGQLGVTTAGMDGPALMGLPTMYLTDAPNVRMGAWVGAVPGYREVVRGDGYLDAIGDALRRWARGC